MGPAVFVVRMLGHWQQQQEEGGGARLDGILAGLGIPLAGQFSQAIRLFHS